MRYPQTILAIEASGLARGASSLGEHAVGEARDEGVEALLAFGVAGFAGAGVPGGRLHGVTAHAAGTEFGEHQRVVGLADADLRLWVAVRRGALIGRARGHDVARLEERVAPLDQRRHVGTLRRRL